MEGTQQAKEQAYLRRARELGRALGDSPELSQLCREAYQEYRRGGISSAAYNAIYTVAWSTPSPGKEEIMSNEKVFQMKLQKVYPLLVAKAEKRAVPGERWTRPPAGSPGTARSSWPPCWKVTLPTGISSARRQRPIPTGALSQARCAG